VRTPRSPRTALLAAALCVGCVSLPPEMLPIAENPAGAFEYEEPGPGASAVASSRFLVKAHGGERARLIAEMAERDYQSLMADTGLFYFRPGGLYPILVYGTAEEYLRKARAPEWSGGLAVGNAIFTYDGPDMPRILAHEITHLIFLEYMGGRGFLRWFNEGLAVYEELHVAEPAKKAELERWLVGSHRSPMPLAELVRFTPGGPGTDQWYAQSASVARYLVETGGRNGVEKFLKAFREGAGLDAALAAGFPTLCDSLAGLEKHWLTLSR